MFHEEGNTLNVFVRPPWYTQCALVNNTEHKHDLFFTFNDVYLQTNFQLIKLQMIQAVKLQTVIMSQLQYYSRNLTFCIFFYSVF